MKSLAHDIEAQSPQKMADRVIFEKVISLSASVEFDPHGEATRVTQLMWLAEFVVETIPQESKPLWTMWE